MKKFSKKFFSLVSVAVTLSLVLVAPMNVSAASQMLGYDLNGEEIWGNSTEKLVGFDDDGNPIIIDNSPQIGDFMGYDDKGEPIYYNGICTSSAKDVIGDSSTIGDSTTIGDSDYYQQFIDAEPTNIRGDINYDGKVNSADILFLRRYLLHLLKW